MWRTMSLLLAAVVLALSTHDSTASDEITVDELSHRASVLQEEDERARSTALSQLLHASAYEVNADLIRLKLQPLLARRLAEIESLRADPPSREWIKKHSPWLTEEKAQILMVLTRIADASTAEILVAYLDTGRMVGDGLARIGMPAIQSTLEQMARDPNAIIQGAYVLEEIVTHERKQNGEGLIFFRDTVLPQLERIGRELTLEWVASERRTPEQITALTDVERERLQRITDRRQTNLQRAIDTIEEIARGIQGDTR